MMKVLEGIKELIEEELKDIKKKGCLTPQELESVHKAVETIKYIDELNEKEEMGGYDEEYSGRYGYPGRRLTRMNMNGYSNGYSGHYDLPMIQTDPMYTTYQNDYSGCYNRHGYSYGNYNGNYSGDNRNRDSYGRYSSNGYDRMYSREGATSRMVEKLENMLNEACTENERDAIRSCIGKLSW